MVAKTSNQVALMTFTHFEFAVPELGRRIMIEMVELCEFCDEPLPPDSQCSIHGKCADELRTALADTSTARVIRGPDEEE